ncbi:MAG: hypothetical protein ACREMP_04560 [Candidatus Tyrphobacter sp.]
MTTLSTATYVHRGSLTLARAAVADYVAAKAYLRRDPGERRLFDRLEHAHGRYFTLRVNDRNDDSFDPSTDTIDWDPHSAMRTSNGGRQSPTLGLGHEVDHAVESPRREAQLDARASVRFDNAEERRVIRGSELHAARTLGEGTRDDHFGRCHRVSSPTMR